MTRQDTARRLKDFSIDTSRSNIKYIGQRNLPFYIGVDKQEFLIYNIIRNGNPAPNSVLLMKRKSVPFIFSFIHLRGFGNPIPFFVALFPQNSGIFMEILLLNFQKT